MDTLEQPKNKDLISAARGMEVHFGDGATRGVKKYHDEYFAADYLGLSTATLRRLRLKPNINNGPNFYRLGASVKYVIEDLDAWARQRTARSVA